MTKNLNLIKVGRALAAVGIDAKMVYLSVEGLGVDLPGNAQLQIIDPEGMYGLTGYSHWSIGVIDFDTYEYHDEVTLTDDTDPRAVALEALGVWHRNR